MKHMDTLRKIIMIITRDHTASTARETAQALAAYGAMGFETDLLVADRGQAGSEKVSPQPEELLLSSGAAAYDALCIADSTDLIRILKECGAAAAGYAHTANRTDRLDGAEYVLSELPYIDGDSLVKIWQRQRDLPWSILETERCLVREFVPGDMEAIMDLYDDRAREFLEPPSPDIDREREILKAYIDRVYRLAGYGDWAVLLRESGELIGRSGFSFPLRVKGLPAHDAAFGYLLGAPYRGLGIASEVCSAQLRYGFEKLGFETVIAETDNSNVSSRNLLHKLGFVPVTENAGKRYYICRAKIQ